MTPTAGPGHLTELTRRKLKAECYNPSAESSSEICRPEIDIMRKTVIHQMDGSMGRRTVKQYDRNTFRLDANA
ncbi:hypothetical protein H109_07095 [Trichophyton interdigitale MR816]|uniref:Uncharacterized protein n=1 Tax=Trichophyton interdigitale (strain MR816) TaxID=1215338 RepID=A0A059IZL5_TRIIM|nr:hypothetical protein H109_07095 [Trichophyton interdigitale MR816]